MDKRALAIASFLAGASAGNLTADQVAELTDKTATVIAADKYELTSSDITCIDNAMTAMGQPAWVALRGAREMTTQGWRGSVEAYDKDSQKLVGDYSNPLSNCLDSIVGTKLDLPVWIDFTCAKDTHRTECLITARGNTLLGTAQHMCNSRIEAVE